MGALTPQYLFDLESRMKVIQSDSYSGLLANLWWPMVATERPSTSRRERLIWLLDTARIEYVNALGGEVQFEDILSQTTEYENLTATGGLTLNRNQLEDIDGDGVDLATQWSRGIGAYAAYWPQKQVAAAIRAGTTELTYDGKAFFATDHPLNPFKTSVGTFSNLIAAKPIDETNAATLEIAFKNLADVFAAIRGIKQATGTDPRGLRATALLVPPALSMRAQQLTGAKFIGGSTATTGGGSMDVEAVVRSWGIGQPVICDELGAGYTGGSDTSYYVLATQPGTSELGPLTYVNREPFQVLYHGDVTDAQLARMNELQWMTRGRNVVGYGHPFLLFKINAT